MQTDRIHYNKLNELELMICIIFFGFDSRLLQRYSEIDILLTDILPYLFYKSNSKK